MNGKRILVTAIAAALVVAALPVFAGAVAPSEELAAFFADRGVDTMYLGKGQAEVPPDQWARINEIVATPDFEDADTVERDYDDDHDVLNSLVFATLYGAAAEPGETVTLSLGRTRWTHTRESQDVESDTDIYGFPINGNYPIPRG